MLSVALVFISVNISVYSTCLKYCSKAQTDSQSHTSAKRYLRWRMTIVLYKSDIVILIRVKLINSGFQICTFFFLCLLFSCQIFLDPFDLYALDTVAIAV